MADRRVFVSTPKDVSKNTIEQLFQSYGVVECCNWLENTSRYLYKFKS